MTWLANGVTSRACHGSAAVLASPLVVMIGLVLRPVTDMTRWAYSLCFPGGTNRTTIPVFTAETGIRWVNKTEPGP